MIKKKISKHISQIIFINAFDKQHNSNIDKKQEELNQHNYVNNINDHVNYNISLTNIKEWYGETYDG